MKISFAACICGLLLYGLPAHNFDVEDLLATMSIEEKIGQLTQLDICEFVNDNGKIDYNKIRKYYENYHVGSLMNSYFAAAEVGGEVGLSAKAWRELISNIHHIVSESNKTIKIPIVYGIDAAHGATYVYGAALFPQSITMAATFNEELTYKTAEVTSKDCRAAGIPWIFSPVLGIGIQPLWSRFQETFGEDPLVVSKMGAAMINGIQHIRKDGGIPIRAAATMKHFIAYSNPRTGHDRSPVESSDRAILQLFLPPFQAAIDAGVMAAMEGYHDLAGVPVVSSSYYLKTMLRNRLKFNGVLVTDYAEVKNLNHWHFVAPTLRDAVKLAISDTSIDISMVPDDLSFPRDLLQLVRNGSISRRRLDESVRRVLQFKETLGLFRNDLPLSSASLSRDGDDNNVTSYPFMHGEPAQLVDTVGQNSDWQLSLDAAREAITLLKNNGNLLPLPRTAGLIVTGPTADSLTSMTGGWSFHWQGAQSDEEFIRGATIKDAFFNGSIFDSAHRQMAFVPGPTLEDTTREGDGSPEQWQSDLDRDVETVRNLTLSSGRLFNAIIVCVGEQAYAEKPGDLYDLKLPKRQIAYVKALSMLPLPIVLVLVEGRPRLLDGAADVAAAVVHAYVPGPLGGRAVVEVIGGVTVPSGRLPYTYPRYSGNLPYPYYHQPGDRCIHTDLFPPAKSLDIDDCKIEWPFGTGLSYTTFSYSNLKVSHSSILIARNSSWKEVTNSTTKNILTSGLAVVTVTLTVTNTGTVAGKDTVLLFLYDIYRRVSPEYKLLKGFKKVHLQPCEETNVSFKLVAEDFRYIGIDNRYVLESGEFRVGVGVDSDCRDPNWRLVHPLTCKSIDVTVGDDYNQWLLCSRACEIWAADGGVCGLSVGPRHPCESLCMRQEWDWLFVSCLEMAQVENCRNKEHYRCFDPGVKSLVSNGSSSTPDGGKNKNKHAKPVVFLLTWAIICSAFIGVALGAVLTFLVEAYLKLMADRAEEGRGYLRSTQSRFAAAPTTGDHRRHDGGDGGDAGKTPISVDFQAYTSIPDEDGAAASEEGGLWIESEPLVTPQIAGGSTAGPVRDSSFFQRPSSAAVTSHQAAFHSRPSASVEAFGGGGTLSQQYGGPKATSPLSILAPCSVAPRELVNTSLSSSGSSGGLLREIGSGGRVAAVTRSPGQGPAPSATADAHGAGSISSLARTIVPTFLASDAHAALAEGGGADRRAERGYGSLA